MSALIMNDNEKMYWVALQAALSGKTHSIATRLVETYGSMEAFWKAKDKVEAPGLPEQTRQRLMLARSEHEPARLWETLLEKNIGAICSLEDGFPKELPRFDDCPAVLFYYGDIRLINSAPAAIVGSRKCTAYGKTMAGAFAKGFAEAGVPVISGMAKGIDAAAHEAALEEIGGTIAVLGCGVDVVYPPANRALYHRIVERGLVISEFFPGVKPEPWRFPLRNRIISGLSRFVLLIECEARSGALITCDWAAEQGKDVWALPGPVTNPYSVGPLRLILEGAMMALSPRGILGYYTDGDNTERDNTEREDAERDVSEHHDTERDNTELDNEERDNTNRDGAERDDNERDYEECDNSERDNIERDNTEREDTELDHGERNNSKRDDAEHDVTKRDNSKRDGARHDVTERDRAERDRAGSGRGKPERERARARARQEELFAPYANDSQADLSGPEKKVLELISYYPSHINYLIASYRKDAGEAEKSIGNLYLHLTKLLSSRLIEKLPGDYYQRV